MVHLRRQQRAGRGGRRLQDRWSTVGARVLLKTRAGHLLARMFSGVLHYGQQPSLTEMLTRVRIVRDARAVRSSLTLSVDETDWNQWRVEYGELEKMLDRRYAECVSFSAPVIWRIERQTGLLLYALIRRGRPRVVVEAGVANGHSTVISLSALQANAFGEFHSFDISNSVGSLLRDAERARWTLHVCPPRSASTRFRHLVNELGPVDLFFHDSDHSYLGQFADLLSVWPALGPGATVVVDDVNEAWAFFDFAREHHGAAIGLFDSRKLTGVFSSAG